jgi:hypothetical protein
MSNQLPDGCVLFTIYNNSNVPLTARLVQDSRIVKDKHVQVGIVNYYDAGTDPDIVNAIMPGKADTQKYGIVGQPTETVTLVAALFADGTTFGDRVGCQILIDRRAYILQLQKEAVNMLETASQQHMPRSWLIATFNNFKTEHLRTTPTFDYNISFGFIRASAAAEYKRIVTLLSATILENLNFNGPGASTSLEGVENALLEKLHAKQTILMKSMPDSANK